MTCAYGGDCPPDACPGPCGDNLAAVDEILQHDRREQRRQWSDEELARRIAEAKRIGRE